MSFDFPDLCDFIAGNFQGAVDKYYHDSYSEWFGQWLQTCPYHVKIIYKHLENSSCNFNSISGFNPQHRKIAY